MSGLSSFVPRLLRAERPTWEETLVIAVNETSVMPRLINLVILTINPSALRDVRPCVPVLVSDHSKKDIFRLRSRADVLPLAHLTASGCLALEIHAANSRRSSGKTGPTPNISLGVMPVFSYSAFMSCRLGKDLPFRILQICAFDTPRASAR